MVQNKNPLCNKKQTAFLQNTTKHCNGKKVTVYTFISAILIVLTAPTASCLRGWWWIGKMPSTPIPSETHAQNGGTLYAVLNWSVPLYWLCTSLRRIHTKKLGRNVSPWTTAFSTSQFNRSFGKSLKPLSLVLCSASNSRNKGVKIYHKMSLE